MRQVGLKSTVVFSRKEDTDTEVKTEAQNGVSLATIGTGGQNTPQGSEADSEGGLLDAPTPGRQIRSSPGRTSGHRPQRPTHR